MPSIEKKRNSFSSPLFLQSLDHPIFKKKKKFAQMTAILSILIKVHSHVCDIFRQVKAL